MRKTGRIIALDNVLGGYDQKKQQVEASQQRSQDMQQQAKDLAEQIKQLPAGTSAKDRRNRQLVAQATKRSAERKGKSIGRW